MVVTDHPKPSLKEPGDALLCETTTGISGSDLHMYDGRTPLEKGTVVGHEIMGVGVIEETGEAVRSIRRGAPERCRSMSPADTATTATAATRMPA